MRDERQHIVDRVERGERDQDGAELRNQHLPSAMRANQEQLHRTAAVFSRNHTRGKYDAEHEYDDLRQDEDELHRTVCTAERFGCGERGREPIVLDEILRFRYFAAKRVTRTHHEALNLLCFRIGQIVRRNALVQIDVDDEIARRADTRRVRLVRLLVLRIIGLVIGCAFIISAICRFEQTEQQIRVRKSPAPR